MQVNLSNVQMKNNTELLKGETISFHGGLFECLEDAHPVQSAAHHGPDYVTVCNAVCLSGEVQGYFRPGTIWNFQGNREAMRTVLKKD